MNLKNEDWKVEDSEVFFDGCWKCEKPAGGFQWQP